MVNSLFPMIARGVMVRRRGKRLLGPVDMTLHATGITVVLGPNGAGKTTLLKALHGLERLNAGQVNWSIPDTEQRRSCLGGCGMGRAHRTGGCA